MKSFWIPIFSGVLMGAGVIALLPEDSLFLSVHDDAEEQGNERWACPMMDFIGAKPGDCPVCGMKMTRVTSGELSREQVRRIGLETHVVGRGPAAVTVRAYGVADYDHRFTRIVIPRVSGRIVERHMATWGCCTTVAEGEPIIDLYSPELIAAQGELKAALSLGDAELVRNVRERFVRWNLSTVADDLVAGGPVLDVVTIRSPFAGQVLLQDFEMANEALAVGREVAPDTPLLRLVDPDKLVLVLHVSETRARWLKEGQSVLIDSDDQGPLPQVKAFASRVAAEIDPVLRSREVRVYLEGVRDLLIPGSLVNARFQAALAEDLRPAEYAQRESWGEFILIPKTAVLSTGIRHVAWRVAQRYEDGRLRFEPVSLGLGPRIEDEHGNDQYIVLSGLKSGDEVAMQGAFLIDSQAQLAGSVSLLNSDEVSPGGDPHANH